MGLKILTAVSKIKRITLIREYSHAILHAIYIYFFIEKYDGIEIERQAGED